MGKTKTRFAKKFFFLALHSIAFFSLSLRGQAGLAGIEWERVLEARIDNRTVPAAFDSGGTQANIDLVDIDNDQDYDLFIGDLSGKLFFYENVGNPFNPVWNKPDFDYNGISTPGYTSPSLVDLDHDQDFDLILGDVNGDLTFVRNEGSLEIPVWGSPTNLQAGLDVTTFQNHPVRPTFADWDGDGELDLFLYAATDFFNPYFLYKIHHYRDTQPGPGWNFVLVTNDFYGLENRFRPPLIPDVPSLPQVGPPFVSLDDLEGDGDLDILTGQLDARPHILLNTGSVSNVVWELVEDYAPQPRNDSDPSIRLADMDGDGDRDMITGSLTGPVSLLYKIDDPVIPFLFSSTETIFAFTTFDLSSWSAPHGADFYNDGDDDLLISGLLGYTMIVENMGTPASAIWKVNSRGDRFVEGRFWDPLSVAPDNIYEFQISPVAGDLDGDGDLDIIAGDREGTFYHFENIGSPALPVFEELPAPIFPGLSYSQKISPAPI